MKVAIAVLFCLAAPALSKTVGSIQVKDYGEVWVIAPDWATGAIQVGKLCRSVGCDHEHDADA